MYHGCTPTWRFHTGLCKFLRHISTNIWSLGERTSLKLGEVTQFVVFYNIKISQLFPLDGFWFIFLLRDSENDLRTEQWLDQCNASIVWQWLQHWKRRSCELNDGSDEVLSSPSYLLCKLNAKRVSDQRSKCWNARGSFSDQFSGYWSRDWFRCVFDILLNVTWVFSESVA